MPNVDLEAQLAMVQAREAQRRAAQAHENRQAQQAQTQQGTTRDAQGASAAASTASTASTASIDAIAARNEEASHSWTEFQAPTTNSNAAPQLPSTEMAPETPAQETTTPSTPLQQTLQANPNIRTNQDLINHYYRQGGGDWNGAARLATADGVNLHQLTRQRAALVDRSGASTPGASSQTPTPTPAGEIPPPSSTNANGVQTYRPGSPEQVALFTEAGRRMGLSEAEAQRWATSPGLQNILQRESGGQVGRPNYTYGARSEDPSRWSSVHDELRSGRKTARSSATGLGQLLLSNVERYYPNGRQGIGNPMEEAVGMMRYIQDRYGTPENAWAQYGRNHEGY